jgi:hypothetical protein
MLSCRKWLTHKISDRLAPALKQHQKKADSGERGEAEARRKNDWEFGA